LKKMTLKTDENSQNDNYNSKEEYENNILDKNEIANILDNSHKLHNYVQTDQARANSPEDAAHDPEDIDNVNQVEEDK
jgi:hypothetical protein